MPWLITVSPKSSIPIRARSSRLGLHRRPPDKASRSAWMARRLAGQCLRRAVMAHHQIRGGIFASLRASKARHALRSARYLHFYNERRPHASLDGMAPDQACFTPLPFRSAGLTPADTPPIEAEILFR